MSIKVKINNDWVDTNIQAVRGVNHVNSEDVYTKEETEKKFATKTEVQTQINNSITKENIENTIEAWLEEDNESTNGEVYTKTESDALLSGKVSKTDIVQSTGTSTTAVMSQKAVSDFEDIIRDQVNNYKPIVIEGNVTNAADEEDITSENGLLKLKNRSALNGMGYVILRKGKTFAEQVTQANTIYEIRYDFDLNGTEITIPENCILKFNGGHLKYKDIIISTDTLCGKEIGMVPNTDDYGVSASNYKKLVNFINLGFHIIIDDVYYIYTTSDVITADNLIITGKGSISKLICKNFNNGVFVIKNNINTISIKDITIDTDAPLARANIFVNIKQSGPLFIKNVNIENCSSKNIRIFSYYGEDIDMSTGNTGIHSINIRNCNINETVMYFVATDVPIDYIHIECVKVTNLYGTLFSLATTNEYTNQSGGFCDKLIINDCFVENTYIFEDEVAYLSFVVAEFKNIYYYNNTVKNIISTNPKTVAYDAYLTCNNLWYYNNVVENILCAEPQYGDIFKCKMVVNENQSSLRYICDNYYRVNKDYLEKKGVDYLFVNSVGNLQHCVDFFYFNNNTIQIPSPYKLSPGNFINSKYAEFCNNSIIAPIYNDKGTSFIMVSEKSLNSEYEIIVKGNTIKSINTTDNDYGTIIRGGIYQQSDIAKTILIENNTIEGVNIDMPNYRVFNTKNITIKNNTLIHPSTNSNILRFVNGTLIIDKYTGINSILESDVTLKGNGVLSFPDGFKYAQVKFEVENKIYKFFINLNDENNKFIVLSEDTIRKSNSNIYLHIGNFQLYLTTSGVGIGNNTDESVSYIKKLSIIFSDTEGDHILLLKGTTENRPILSLEKVGFQYYDTDLKKYIVWDGTNWTNMDGTVLI